MMARQAARVLPRTAAAPSRAARGFASIKPIELHYTPTPNGYKVTLLLEEANVPYVVRPIDLAKGEQHTPEFLRISPNGRMPAIVDPNLTDTNCEDGLAVFESGAISASLRPDPPTLMGYATALVAPTRPVSLLLAVMHIAE
eukprot:2741726-Prymnesium_polylepis.1